MLTRQNVPSHTPCLVGRDKGAMKAVWIPCTRAVSSVMCFVWPACGNRGHWWALGAVLWVTVKCRSHCSPLRHHCSRGIHSTAGAGGGVACSGSHASSTKRPSVGVRSSFWVCL